MLTPMIASAGMSPSGLSLSMLERLALVGSNGAGMNACIACCDRWADGGRPGFEWIDRDGGSTVRTYDALRDDAARFANLLVSRGIAPGDVVAAMLPLGAQMLTVILGAWRAGAVFQRIAEGASSIATEARVNHTGRAAPKLIVTDMRNRGTLGLVKACPPILVVSKGARMRPGDVDFGVELSRHTPDFAPVARDGDDPFLLLVGGRGGAMAPVRPTLRSLLGILAGIPVGREPDAGEIGWDVNDPEWSFDLYFSVLRPLLLGDAVTAYEQRISARPLLPRLPASETSMAAVSEIRKARHLRVVV